MISNSPLAIQTPYVVYVLCRVHPNAYDEVKDEMCEDVPVTTLMSAVLIFNRQIQVAYIILVSPSCLTLNLKHALSTMCFFCCLCSSWYNYVNYVLIWWTLFVVWTMSTMWTLSMTCELCGLCELSSSCMNYVDLMLYGMLVMYYLSTCDPCWASMNYYMMSQLYFCVKKCGRKEKKLFPGLSRHEHCANGCRARDIGVTTLSRRSRWCDKTHQVGQNFLVSKRLACPQQACRTGLGGLIGLSRHRLHRDSIVTPTLLARVTPTVLHSESLAKIYHEHHT